LLSVLLSASPTLLATQEAQLYVVRQAKAVATATLPSARRFGESVSIMHKFTWIDGSYNRRRLHSTLGMHSHNDYENGTLGQPGAGLAASRLADSPIMIKEKAA
jgi:hypothetical protein